MGLKYKASILFVDYKEANLLALENLLAGDWLFLQVICFPGEAEKRLGELSKQTVDKFSIDVRYPREYHREGVLRNLLFICL